ncbi:hypothetical protein NDI56_19050 [Haloarcula sp. S1CR25-12]|uniref:Uncharacterized protein n=1 Tax=Haloarcula saliterrae TaxID=2950534 RepID=A0ABU2FGY7_9EURY|nr:hypothetical protein [Haloarcula sp. S1CR25-12]MDS0261502.1 hypothetical protein [Haloarcula sp. S1CR25-12]
MFRAYRRFEEWASNLSRGVYAALSGALTGGCTFAIGALFRYEPLLAQAPLLAVTMFAVSYVFDIRRFEA